VRGDPMPELLAYMHASFLEMEYRCRTAPPWSSSTATRRTPLCGGPLLAELGRVDAFTLSPPGFGVPAPEGFESTVDGYRDWLVARLEQFGRPIDLVGHDWGGAHVMQVAMRRPDLVRSWASDALGVFAPDFVWHPMAQV
jgi:pimeloyl-ACP methyl ester carboxylesterase